MWLQFSLNEHSADIYWKINMEKSAKTNLWTLTQHPIKEAMTETRNFKQLKQLP